MQFADFLIPGTIILMISIPILKDQKMINCVKNKFIT